MHPAGKAYTDIVRSNKRFYVLFYFWQALPRKGRFPVKAFPKPGRNSAVDAGRSPLRFWLLLAYTKSDSPQAKLEGSIKDSSLRSEWQWRTGRWGQRPLQGGGSAGAVCDRLRANEVRPWGRCEKNRKSPL